MEKIIDFITNLGFEAVKDRIVDEKDNAIVKEQITSFLERQRKIHYYASLDEEIDFGGLEEYIKTNLMDDVKKRLFGDKSERTEARAILLERASQYAKQNSRISEERCRNIVGISTDILRKFYRSRVNRELRFIAGEIEDIIEQQHADTREIIKQESTAIQTALKASSSLSIDVGIDLVKNGRLEEVNDSLKTYLNGISGGHTLFPHYGYSYNGKYLISYPLTEEAAIKYPENYKIVAESVLFEDEVVPNLGGELFDKAYMHQMPITINIKKAVKYLGDCLDPAQIEAKSLDGSIMTIYPPEFPKAFSCNLKVGDEIAIPYLLLRMKMICDDGTIVVTNVEQDKPLYSIELRIKPSECYMTFKITPNNPTNEESLRYRKFLKDIREKNVITISALTSNEMIVSARADQLGFSDLDDEISFLEKIVLIERYFNISIEIPNEITVGDNLLVDRLYCLIQDQYKGNWDSYDFKMNLTKENKESIINSEDMDLTLAYSAVGTFNLFGNIFSLPIRRELECCRIKDLGRLKEKVSVLDVGDPLKFVVIPGNSVSKGSYIDRIIPENELSTDTNDALEATE